jgi:hypothetical protein
MLITAGTALAQVADTQVDAAIAMAGAAAIH